MRCRRRHNGRGGLGTVASFLLVLTSCNQIPDQPTATENTGEQDAFAVPPIAEDFNFTEPPEGVNLAEIGE